MKSHVDTLPALPNFIGGRRVESSSERRLVVTNPATGKGIAEVPLSTATELDQAVARATEAQRDWAATPIKDRVQVLFRLKALIEGEVETLARVITEENGKTHAESRGSILRAVECLEFASSLPQITLGSGLDVSPGVECRSSRHPMGITAGITPFNFPLMVPLWMAPNSIGCGNAFILKPSEQTPMSSLELARLFEEAGLPPGIFSVVHGDRDIVEAICDHPGISAVGFVGSTKVAKAVYQRGCSNYKRVRALGGAKNHLVVVPDADPEMTATNVVASVTGCAGQRCMAASVLVAVGNVDPILDRIHSSMEQIEAGRDIGPMISAVAKQRVHDYLDQAGDRVRLDGRHQIASGVSTEGFYCGPAIIDHAKPEDAWSCDEIFGPVLTIIRCQTLEEALEIENQSQYGNAAAIYTSSGQVAEEFVERASAGMVGVNVGVPVPREPFAFGGWNDSNFGDGDITGENAIDFWTRSKKITGKWTMSGSRNWMS